MNGFVLYKYYLCIYIGINTGNCGKVMGLLSYIVIILFILPNVRHLRKKYKK